MKKLLLVSGLSLLSLQGFSQAMYLDSTFSNDGLVYDLFNQHSWGTDVAVQADSKILGTIQKDDKFRVYRLNVDGTWDNSFDSDGMFEYDVAFIGAEECNAVTVQPDGKILVLGTARPNSNMDVVLMRLNADGTFDNDFNANGMNAVDAGDDNYGRSMVLRLNGKILVSGITDVGSSQAVLLMQFKADGTLDSTFGTNGIVIEQYMGNMTNAYHLALQADGKAVVCGNMFVNTDAKTFVARFNTDGTIDNTFDTDGWVVLDHGVSGIEAGVRVVVQSTGKIVFGSRTTDQMNKMYFNRYNTDGSVDNTFGTSGQLVYEMSTPGNTTELKEMILMPNDDILASGATYSGTGTGEFDYGMLCIKGSEGTVQTGFANNGVIKTDFLGFYDFIYGMDITPDGKLVAAGSTRIDAVTTLSYPSVARYKLITLGVKEVQQELSVKVYPNPSNGTVIIEGNEAANIHILNAVGQVVRTIELDAKNNYTQKVTGLPQGVFFLQSPNGIMNQKIVSY